MRISESTPKQHCEKGAHWRSSFHHSHCRLSLLAVWGCLHNDDVLNSDILQCGQDASVVQSNEFIAALKSLCDCVSRSMHAAQVSQSFSSLLRHCRMVAHALPIKHPSKDSWATCKSQEMLQKISSKILLLCFLSNYRPNWQHRINFKVDGDFAIVLMVFQPLF